MKKKLHILLCGILSVIMVLSICVVAIEPFDSQPQIEVIFSESSRFTDEQKEAITEYFQNHTDSHDEASKGIICTLLGHNLQTEYVDIVIHKVFTIAPRCIKDTYRVTLCTRCDYTQSQLIERTDFDCCPED